MSTARGERRLRLAASRDLLYKLPLGELFELPGRPHVVYQIRSYASTDNQEEAVLAARNDVPFLFKAFETGQIGPKRMAKMHGGKPRMATIHEYLDWTVTAQEAQEDDELDFGGFRIVVVLPRYVSHWPYPGSLSNREGKRTHPDMGAPLPPYPLLQTHGRPVSAATIRSGPGYLEIPFVATHEGKRGRGYCRCLIEAIEDIARALAVPKLMLCSTNDAVVKSTWHHLGFDFTSEEEMEHWDIPHSDLVYLQNTTQMHKDVAPPGQYRSIIIKQGEYKVRTYIRYDKPLTRPRLHIPPKKAPPKKAPGLHAHAAVNAAGMHHAAARLSQGMAAMHPFQAVPDMGVMGGPGMGLVGPVPAISMQPAASDHSWRSDMIPEVSSASGGLLTGRRGREDLRMSGMNGMGGMSEEPQSAMQWAPAKGMAPASMHLPSAYGGQAHYPVTTSHPFSQPGPMSGPHFPMQQPATQHPPSWGGPTSYGPGTHGGVGTISGLPPVSSQHPMSGMHGPPPQPYVGPQQGPGHMAPGMGPGPGLGGGMQPGPGPGGPMHPGGAAPMQPGVPGGPPFGGGMMPAGAAGPMKPESLDAHGLIDDPLGQLPSVHPGTHDLQIWSGPGKGLG